MNNTHVNMLPSDVEFQQDGRALIMKTELNQFIEQAFAEYGNVTLIAGVLVVTNVNCKDCIIDIYCGKTPH